MSIGLQGGRFKPWSQAAVRPENAASKGSRSHAAARCSSGVARWREAV